jgi:hypothetical protein
VASLILKYFKSEACSMRFNSESIYVFFDIIYLYLSIIIPEPPAPPFRAPL